MKQTFYCPECEREYSVTPTDRELELEGLARKEFERLHHEGADKWIAQWLGINQVLVDAFHRTEYAPRTSDGGIDIRLKALMSQVAFDVMEYFDKISGATK